VTRSRIAAAIIALLAGSVFARTRAVNPEEAAVRRMATRFAETWNVHDLDAMADLFSDDADFVNVAGERLHGRLRIRDVHAQRHRMQFRDSVLTIKSVVVRFLEPDIAVAHIQWDLKGDRDADGTSRAPRQGLMSWVVTKRQGTWRIESAHNTNVRPAGAPSP
jgi:uncharacterized protein (TIGR02246 family)